MPLNNVWREIHDELGIGSASAKNLNLTPEDHIRLREWVSLEAGVDPLTTQVNGDRLETASQVRDEKWSSKTVFSGMIQVNVLSGVVPLQQGDAITPSSTLLSVASEDLDTDRLNAVVLVENGIVARHWHKCRIPTELSAALMVYRGHGGDADTVRRWLNGLPDTVKKVGYFDFDPAGLGMAIDYGVDTILIPDSLNDHLVEGINNKPETHVEQLARRPDLGDQLPNSCQETWAWMTAEGRKSAVTQERITSMNWLLRELSMSN